MVMQTYPILTKLSRTYREGIGSVVFEWALLENSVAKITYYLLNVGLKHGRVSVRSPRAVDQIAMIRQLMTIDGISIKDDGLDKIQKGIGHLERSRDLVAHGIWLKSDVGGTIVQDLSGTWKPSHRKKKVARRIDPQGLLIKESDLKTVAQLIRICRGKVEMFGEKLKVVVQPLRNKSQQQSPAANPQNESN
ncbi:MAG: hypothetical protein AABM33_14930 [Pseudomonadota bacterium]